MEVNEDRRQLLDVSNSVRNAITSREKNLRHIRNTLVFYERKIKKIIRGAKRMDRIPTGNRIQLWKAGIRKKNKQLPTLHTSSMTARTKLCENVREIVVTMADACGPWKDQLIALGFQPPAPSSFVSSVPAS